MPLITQKDYDALAALQQIMQESGAQIKILFGKPDAHWETLWHSDPVAALRVTEHQMRRQKLLASLQEEGRW